MTINDKDSKYNTELYTQTGYKTQSTRHKYNTIYIYIVTMEKYNMQYAICDAIWRWTNTKNYSID